MKRIRRLQQQLLVRRATMEGRLIAVKTESLLAKHKSLVTQPAGDQCNPPPCKQRRTSLEKLEMQEDKTEEVLGDRMQSGNKQRAVKMVKETQGEPSERPHGATSTATGKILQLDPQSGVSDPQAVSAAGQEPQRLVLGTSGDTAVRDHPENGSQQSNARPVLQQEQRSAAVSDEAPHVPAVSTLEQNCGLLPIGDGAILPHRSHIITLQDNVSSAVRDNVSSAVRDNVSSAVRDNVSSAVRDNVSSAVRDNVSSAVRDNVSSAVRDNVAAAVRDNVAAAVREYLAVTGEMVARHSASNQEPRQESGSGGGSSGNSRSRGSPSTSDTSNTDETFKRRNVVRLRHRGAKYNLPDRKFVIRELLCNQMGFLPTNILAVINLPGRQGYDVSFKVRSELHHFWANFFKFRNMDGWDKFSFIPISKPDTVNVTVVFWNEAVPPQDIIIWLQKHCDLMSDMSKDRDTDGIWTGGWRVLVKLRKSLNVTHHLPSYFYIGREKGICFYSGQPRECYKCGRSGHLASVCAYSLLNCGLCGEVGHARVMCKKISCDLCGQNGCPHRDCPDEWHSEDLLVIAEDLKEQALLLGSVLRRPEPQRDISDSVQDQQQSGITKGNMEVVKHSEGASSALVSTSENNESVKIKRRKKDKSSREGEGSTDQRPAKKKANGETELTIPENSRHVLTEAADMEMDREH